MARVPGARTIERALGVLDCFTAAADGFRTTTIAHQCGLPVATTHRILRVLENHGYLVRDPGSAEYSLGPAATSFAREDPLVIGLRRATAPALDAIHRAAGEQAVLSSLSASRDHAVEISVADGDQGVARSGPVAQPAEPKPLHAGASAKVLLAELSNDELDRLLARGLDRVGPATITEPARVRREVIVIRRRGWAFSREETAADTWAVAVPVPRPGAASAAIGISAPLERFDRVRASRYLTLLAGAARRLSRALHAEGRSVAGAGGAA